MTSSQLNLFLIAAERESFSEAAKAFSVSRSAVTQSIRSLEKELGYQLFETGSNKTKLTAAGAFLYPGLLSVSRQADQLLKEASAIAVRKPQLRIGYFSGLRENIIQQTFSSVLKSNHDYDISFHQKMLPELFRDLDEHRVDLIFCPELSVPFPEAYHRFRIMTAEEQCTVPVTHHLSSKEAIYPDMLKGETLILPSSPTPPLSNQDMRQFLKPYQSTCRVIESHTATDTELLGFIHNGIAIKPTFAATNSPRFVCVPFVCPVRANLFLLAHPGCSQETLQLMEKLKNDH